MSNPAWAVPFESIESAYEYVTLLCEGVVENRASLDADIEEAAREGASRRLDALRLASYKLERLQHHTQASQRLLNDLRTLRRLLLGERTAGEK
jgi:transcription termination factor NusB